MIKYDVAKYGTKFLLGTGVLGLYNILFDGQQFSNMNTWYDAMSFGASGVISNAVNDLIYDFLHLSNQGVFPMLSEPLLNMFIYSYMYDNITRPKNRGLGNERGKSTVLFIGVGGNILLKFIESPLLALWGMKSY